jgi:methylase of polypeptide subunit release factors
MLKAKIGLSRRKKVPVFYILGRAYLPHKALKLLWNFRWLNEIEHSKEYAIFETKGNIIKLLNEYLIFDEWKMWEKYYIPRFSLRGKTVLDVGAGCGETALLFFLHSAYKVIAIEPNVKAVECLKENVERNNWNVEIIAEPFSLEHLKLGYDFMKMDGEGCEELLLPLSRIDKPCVVEVHSNKLLNEFERKGWLKVYSMTKDIHIVKNNSRDNK